MEEVVYKEYYGIKYYKWDQVPTERIPNIETDKGKSVLVAGTRQKDKYVLHGEREDSFTLMDQNQAYKSFIKDAVALENIRSV